MYAWGGIEQCFREVVRNPINLTPHIRKGIVSERAYRKVLPPKVVDIADASMKKKAGEVLPSSRVVKKSGSVLPIEQSTAAPSEMPDKSIIIKFFDAYNKLNGSLQSVFPCVFMGKGYKPDGSLLPFSIIVGISVAGVSFLHKKTLVWTN
jgi:hypothetical protein